MRKIEKAFSKTFEKAQIFMHFIEEQLKQMKRIFIFDEALIHFSMEEAKTLSQAIATKIEAFQGLFLLVDHRFQGTSFLFKK